MREPMSYYSTNNRAGRVNFETALLSGLAPDYGLYTMARVDLPVIGRGQIQQMKEAPYAEIAFQVLDPFLKGEIGTSDLQDILSAAYDPEVIETRMMQVTGKSHILWLTNGPTYSFKDYAARFYGRALNYFLEKRSLKRTVLVATSGDTGGAVADALHGLPNVENIVFFPKDGVTDGQRRQMTTLQRNILAFAVNGDFDLCQDLTKNLLGDKKYAEEVLGDSQRLTSANSISLGRLLPQIVFPFYAYSRMGAARWKDMIASVPSGNFGNMLGTVLARAMGLPVAKIICGVNANREFPDFMETGRYVVKPTKKSPSSAMMVRHPGNLARLIDFYGGHMTDERDENGRVIKEGVLRLAPNMPALRKEIASYSVSNTEHAEIIKKVYSRYGVILDPHGAVGWGALERFLGGNHNELSVIYETAHPGKFPDYIKGVLGFEPPAPSGILKQASLPERIYTIESPPGQTGNGLKLTDTQIEEAKEKIKKLLK